MGFFGMRSLYLTALLVCGVAVAMKCRKRTTINYEAMQQ